MYQKNKKVLSLFSGCGGMDLGFEGGFEIPKININQKVYPEWALEEHRKNWLKLPSTTFNTIFANDIRPGAKAVWENYFSKRGSPKGTFHLASIVELVKRSRKGLFCFPKNIDVVTGGFPCQDFSVAGKRMGFNSHKSHYGNVLSHLDNPSLENRGMLYTWMREVIDIVRPKMFVAENVKGLISLSEAKTIIENDFKSIGDNGYLVVGARVLHAAEYGVPQGRERVIFFGFRKDLLNEEAMSALSNDFVPEEYDPYPIATHTLGNNADRMSMVTVREALSGLLEPEETDDLSQKSYSKAKWYGKHCQGQTEVNLDDIGPTIRSEHHGNIEYRRLNPEHGGKYLNELQKGLQERRLTVRECARIQTFPDDYDFIIPRECENQPVSTSEAYKLIGNAVPPLLAFHIAKRLEAIWSKIFNLQEENNFENVYFNNLVKRQPSLFEVS
ncbi:MAG: DNA (cytosine-5-)-methyltransferase [Nitrospinae bacterium]|nr:DNA (cytosine-5-)-methyltransferase [Nitrospinota bacterium]